MAAERSSRVSAAAPYADLVLLALALPVFLLADLPMLGYAAAAAAWLAQRALQRFAGARASRNLAAGDRRTAMGYTAVAMLGRLWLVALVVLLVGLLGEREDGLAAAVLSAALFTVYFAGEAAGQVLASKESR